VCGVVVIVGWKGAGFVIVGVFALVKMISSSGGDLVLGDFGQGGKD